MANSNVTTTKTTPDAGLLTRSQVAKRLGVSVSTVRRMEGDKLHPTCREDGTHVFDPGEVDLLASCSEGADTEPMTEGELASAVFERFEDEQDLSQIVRELKQPPQVIRELYAEWRIGLVAGHRYYLVRKLREGQDRARKREEEQHERTMTEQRAMLDWSKQMSDSTKEADKPLRDKKKRGRRQRK